MVDFHSPSHIMYIHGIIKYIAIHVYNNYTCMYVSSYIVANYTVVTWGIRFYAIDTGQAAQCYSNNK